MFLALFTPEIVSDFRAEVGTSAAGPSLRRVEFPFLQEPHDGRSFQPIHHVARSDEAMDAKDPAVLLAYTTIGRSFPLGRRLDHRLGVDRCDAGEVGVGEHGRMVPVFLRIAEFFDELTHGRELEVLAVDFVVEEEPRHLFHARARRQETSILFFEGVCAEALGQILAAVVRKKRSAAQSLDAERSLRVRFGVTNPHRVEHVDARIVDPPAQI